MAGNLRKWIRRTTTLAVLAIVVVIVVVAVQRVRLTRPHLLRLLPGSVERMGEPSDEAVGVYEGFEHAESVAGEPIFLLKALRTLGLESGWYELEGVSLELYRTGVGVATLTCERARYDSRSRDTQVEGAVHIEFEDGTFLDTRRGSFNSSSRRFTSSSEVLFGGSDFIGRAGGAEYHIPSDSAALTGGVTVTAAGGTLLRTSRVVYERVDGTARFPDGLTVRRGDARLEAVDARMELEPSDWRPVSLALTGGVTFDTGTSSSGWSARGRATRISLDREGGGRWQGRALGGGSWVRLLMFGGDSFVARELKTWQLRFVLGSEGPVSAQSRGVTCWLEVPDVGAQRWVESREGRYYFAEGLLTDVELIDQVRLGTEGWLITGRRARLSTREGRVLITSGADNPARRVSVRGERGRVWSDELHILESGGVAEALGNVQGEMEDADLFGPRGENAEPTRLACDRLTLARERQEMVLRGGARLWQGDRLLLAEEVRVDQEERRLEASGGVRMTVPAADLGDPQSDEVLIVSRTLDYDEVGGTARFRGGVRMSDSKHLLSTAVLVTTRRPEGGLEGFVAEERVVLESLESGRRMQGRHGRYSTKTGILTVTGDPAHLTDENGNVVSGKMLTWNRADDTVTVAGAEGAPSETIYHPEEAP